ncbi:MAG: hypothetical protein CMN37_08595 [SAR116 cluster bacterium]|nr:hypothetical protein [SAR116 cluster bacterium]
MKKILLTIIFLIITEKVFGSNLFNFVDTKGSNKYSQSLVWDGNFIAPNGKRFNLGHFYQSKNFELNLKTRILYKLNSSILIIPFNFDIGYSSDLLSVSPIYSMGFIMSKNIKNINILFGIDNALRIGGDIKENPCYDKFKREFHCGTGVPWADYNRENLNNFYQNRLIFNMSYKF